MKNIHEVIREKESLLARINEELGALRLVLRLLTEDAGASSPGESFPKVSPLREEPPKIQSGKAKSFP